MKMKIKSGFQLKKVLDDYLIIPQGERMQEFEGTIVLNETSAFVWDRMKEGNTETEIIEALCQQYEVHMDKAAKDVREMLEQFDSFGLLE